MGLLDWLTSDVGGNPLSPPPPINPAAAPLVSATNNYQSPGGSAYLSPDELPKGGGNTVVPPLGAGSTNFPPEPATVLPNPPLPPAVPPNPAPTPPLDPSTTDIGGGMQGAGPAPAPPAPVPLPVPRPPGANGPAANTVNPALPPGTPPGQPLSLAPPGQTPMPAPDSSAGAPPVAGMQTALGRALGITPTQASNMTSQFMSGLGAGLKSVGQNWNKPGLAAMAGSAGAAIEGGTKQANTQYDQRLRSLQLAVQAKAEGNKSEFNKNMIEYYIGKNENDKAKIAADASGKTGKAGAWNKPDSQKFIDAQNAMAKDPEISAAKSQLATLAKNHEPNDPEMVTAQANFKNLLQNKQNQYLSGVGLNPAKMSAMQANPPGTAANPMEVTSEEDLKTYLKPGQWYKNPSDGKPYMYIGGSQMQGQSTNTPGPAPGTKPKEDDDD